jgi:phage terminase large subunit
MTMPNTVTLTYLPRGAARDIFARRDPELVLSGPAGTGKSRAALEKVHLALIKHPSARGLMVRKTRRSLTESGMVTYQEKVVHPLDGVRWKASEQRFEYPNGSILAVAGLDKPGKVMSSEWDMIYAQEATELEERDWEALTTRLRNGKMPYQQLLGDCNPDAPTHWLMRRGSDGHCSLLSSRHEDNPVLFDDKQVLTPEGERYLATLDRLTGVRYLRLRKGLWVAAEGIVYEDSWDRARNLSDKFTVPREWPRYLVVDFGYTHPFVCQWWAEDPDGRLWMYREIYMTKRLVEDHAKTIRDVSRWGKPDGEPMPRAIITDHDAEDRQTLERHLGLVTTAAFKNVSAGIQAVASRLKLAGDGKPRLVFMRDAVVQRDSDLANEKRPTCTVDEFESYVWDVRQGQRRGEAPVKDNDHGMDAMRYLVAYFDLKSQAVTYGPDIW